MFNQTLIQKGIIQLKGITSNSSITVSVKTKNKKDKKSRGLKRLLTRELNKNCLKVILPRSKSGIGDVIQVIYM